MEEQLLVNESSDGANVSVIVLDDTGGSNEDTETTNNSILVGADEVSDSTAE